MGLLPMDADILPPSDGRVFKLILTKEEAKPALMELPSQDTQEKEEQLDVNCQIDDSTQIDMEIQAHRIKEDTDDDPKNLKGGILYLGDLHSSQPAKGQKRYDRLAQT